MGIRRNYYKGNTYSYTFVGVSDSHQIQDLGSLLKNLLILCGFDGEKEIIIHIGSMLKETSSSVDEDGLYF